MAQLLSVVAVATNRVEVTLDEAPAQTGRHSAYLTGNWLVTSDTGGGPVERTVAQVRRASDTVWTLVLVGLPRFVAPLLTVASSGAPGVREVTATTEFTGSASCTMPLAAPRPKRSHRAGLDLRLMSIGDGKTPGGCFAVQAGDYAIWSGERARESDYLRRLQAPKGGFAWAPQYGVGLAPKHLTSPAALLTTKREIEQQIKREPTVVGVGVTLTLRGGVLFAGLRVRTTDGADLVTTVEQRG